jgi:hypothetical protein
MTLGHVVGPLTQDQIDDFPDESVVLQNYAVSFEDIKSFIDELGPFVFNRFEGLNDDEKEQVLGHIGQLFLRIITGILDCEPLRNSQNEAVYDSIAPTLPKSLALLKPNDFAIYSAQQAARLAAAWTPDKIGLLESEQLDLRAAYSSEQVLKRALDDLQETVDFNKAWTTASVGVRFPTLMEFAGGLASPFPTTATTESDFSHMNRERSDGRHALQDLALEGILQCKQYERIKLLRS